MVIFINITDYGYNCKYNKYNNMTIIEITKIINTTIVIIITITFVIIIAEMV